MTIFRLSDEALRTSINFFAASQYFDNCFRASPVAIRNLSENCNNVVFKFDFGVIPDANVTTSKSIDCIDFIVKFQNNSTVSDSYLWNFGRYLNDTTSQIFSPTITYNKPGKYKVILTVTDSICLLTDTAFVNLTVLDSIYLKIQSDPQLPLCTSKEITLTAKNNKSADYIIWSTSSNFTDTLNSVISDSTYTFTPSGNGYYYVKAGNSSCFKKDSVFIETISSYLELKGDAKMCKYDELTLQVINSNPKINLNYSWSHDSVIVSPTNLSDVIVSPKVSQYIFVEVDDTKGCILKDSIFVQVSSVDSKLIKATVSADYIPVGEKVTLKGSSGGGYSYKWTPEESVQSPASQQTLAKPLETTLYYFFVSDGICTKHDSVLVKVFPFVCDDPSIFVPNAFSPNGDGNNDVLIVRGKMIKEMTFRIFDRWGELIFETHERGAGWDGTFKGKKMDPDVYDYYLKVTCIDDIESIVKGNITLLK